MGNFSKKYSKRCCNFQSYMLTFVAKGEIMNYFMSIELVGKDYVDARQCILTFCADVDILRYVSSNGKPNKLG